MYEELIFGPISLNWDFGRLFGRVFGRNFDPTEKSIESPPSRLKTRETQPTTNLGHCSHQSGGEGEGEAEGGDV